MMRRFPGLPRGIALLRDQRGVAAIEMAFALPVLALFLFGIFQAGMIMAADAGMQHALGEGARLATLYPTPSDEVIQKKINDKVFGTYIGTYKVDSPSTTVATNPNGGVMSRFKDLRISYSVRPNFLLFTGPQVNFTRTKRVYLSF
jgi:Flp pilus assembly protein TadG